MNTKFIHTTYRLKKAQLVLLAIVLHSVVAIACKCPVLTPVNSSTAKEYDVIFSGTIDSISACSTKGIAKAYFTIDHLYKGKAVQPQVEVIYDCLSSCMMSFSKNEEWLIYANYERFDAIHVQLCSHSRKHFNTSEQDFYLATAKRTFEEEQEFLKAELGTQPFGRVETWNKEQQELKPKNDQPSNRSKIYLVLVSSGVTILIYILTRKKKKKNG